MFEVFASICFITSVGLVDCQDFSVESYDDPMSCEISATNYRKDVRYQDVQCLYIPEDKQ